jgi:hypothetical protein
MENIPFKTQIQAYTASKIMQQHFFYLLNHYGATFVGVRL